MDLRPWSRLANRSLCGPKRRLLGFLIDMQVSLYFPSKIHYGGPYPQLALETPRPLHQGIDSYIYRMSTKHQILLNIMFRHVLEEHSKKKTFKIQCRPCLQLGKHLRHGLPFRTSLYNSIPSLPEFHSKFESIVPFPTLLGVSTPPFTSDDQCSKHSM